jgi:hypothetical protein
MEAAEAAALLAVLQATAGLLDHYERGGAIGPHVEYYANGMLLQWSSWWQSDERATRFPFEPAMLPHLKQCLQIDHWINQVPLPEKWVGITDWRCPELEVRSWVQAATWDGRRPERDAAGRPGDTETRPVTPSRGEWRIACATW